MSEISEMLAEWTMKQARSESSSQMLPEAELSRLDEIAKAIQEPNLFVPGDLVTPRADSTWKGVGRMHVVSRVSPHIDGFSVRRREPSSQSASSVFNVEVVCFTNGMITCFAMPHYALVYWQPEGDVSDEVRARVKGA